VSALDNPLLVSGFDGTIDYDALNELNDPFFGDENRDGIPDHWNQEAAPLHSNHRGYIGEDGQIYRKELTWNKETEEFEREYTDERLYFWTPPAELGDRGLNGDQEAALAGPQGFGASGLYTKAEIQEAWNAKQGMGYLKQHTTWDKYWNFIEKSTALFTDTGYDDMTGGNMTSGNWQDSPEYMALLAESGIPSQFINGDGDVFNFNGTTFVKEYKVDDSFDVNGLLKTVALSALTAGAAGFLAPTLAGALGVSNTVAKGLITAALDMARTGEVDIGTALGLVGGDVLPGGVSLAELGDTNDVLRDVLGAITDELTDPDNYAKEEGDNGTTKVVWGGHGGTDELGNPVVTIPDYSPKPEDKDGGGGGDESSDNSGGGSAVDSSSDTSASNGVLGGENSDISGDILGRQIHEAILRETDPAVRDALIREWEDWTGEEYSDDYYDDKPFDPDQEREPIGHIWIPGDGVEGGLWWPVYDPNEIPDDGTYQQGSTMPTAPPNDHNTGEEDNSDPRPPDWTPTVNPGDIGGENNTGDQPCPEGYSRNRNGECVENKSGGMGTPTVDPEPAPEPTPEDGQCPAGYSRSRNGECVANKQGGMGSGEGGGQGGSGGEGEPCPAGYSRSRNGECVANKQGSMGSGGSGGGSGGGAGTGNGPGRGPGSGPGEGIDFGDGGGMLGGRGDYTPTWGQLFEYTTLTPYQKEKLGPMRNYIKEVKGMLS